MKICDYSSLIFAGNTTVLLIVSLSTDYWEFRTFNKDEILRIVADLEDVDIVIPFDTDSYFQIIMSSDLNCSEPMTSTSLYQAPLFIIQRTCKGADTNLEDTIDVEIMKYLELDIFLQYGNLFRDCDELENAVRHRLGIEKLKPKKCTYFHNQWTSSNIHHEAVGIIELESLSCACAMICIVCVTVGAVTGARGLFNRYTDGRAFQIASIATLVAGFTLTLAIALFHGRCQIFKNMDLFPGHVFPLKDMLNKLRIYSFGWSFMLAWICVFFCYISSYVWLCKAQECRSRYKCFGQTGQVLKQEAIHRLQSMVFVNYMNYRKIANTKEDIVTL